MTKPERKRSAAPGTAVSDRPGQKQAGNVLLIPPSPRYPGSRGDQAVLLTTKDELGSRGFTVTIAVDDPRNPEWAFLRDEAVPLVEMQSARLDGFDRVTVLGTDVFDGAYSTKDFVFFEKVTTSFINRGKPAEIIGFSIRPEVNRELKQRAARLAGRVRMTVRDPISFARFLDFRPLQPPTLVADPAFLLRPDAPPADVAGWIAARKAQGRLCIGVNVNRHLQEDADQVATKLASLLTKIPGAAFVVIPHDSRRVAGDIEMCSRLRDVLLDSGASDVLLLPMLSARVIKGTCALLDCVVTGRMHLAIASLGQGVPVLGIDYNFKMKGLFSYFGLQDWVVTPDGLADVLPKLPPATEQMREKIGAALGRVRWLSARNFGTVGTDPGFGAYDSARFMTWSAAEHRPKWPHPVSADQQLTRSNLRAMLTIDYHRIEKGLAMPSPRTDFGQSSGLVHRLVTNLGIYLDRHGPDETTATILAALSAYAQFSGWAPLREQLAALEARLAGIAATGDAGLVACTRAEQARNGRIDLAQFFGSRCSTRDFSDEPVADADITKAVKMAHEGTPSVCNRQPYRVRALGGQAARQALELQNGNRGFGDRIGKVLLVSVDTQWFETPAERNQPWIAGGLFCMSVMYALHSLGLATCSLNWDVPPLTDVALRERIALNDSEVVIMMIGVGNYRDEFAVARSRRVALDQILKFLD